MKEEAPGKPGAFFIGAGTLRTHRRARLHVPRSLGEGVPTGRNPHGNIRAYPAREDTGPPEDGPFTEQHRATHTAPRSLNQPALERSPRTPVSP